VVTATAHLESTFDVRVCAYCLRMTTEHCEPRDASLSAECHSKACTPFHTRAHRYGASGSANYDANTRVKAMTTGHAINALTRILRLHTLASRSAASEADEAVRAERLVRLRDRDFPHRFSSTVSLSQYDHHHLLLLHHPHPSPLYLAPSWAL
jgi:hypothetical protein